MRGLGFSWVLVGALCVVGCGDDSGGDDTDGSNTDPSSANGSNPSTSGSTNTASGPSTNPATTDPSDPSMPPTTDPSDTSGDTGSSTGEPPVDDGIPMFVALGQGGRRLVSCDDGQTWVGDQSVETNDEDHGPYSSRAVAYGDRTFVLGMGWGNPARISRSFDGINWQETLPPTGNRGLSGVDYGAGRFLAVEGSRTWVSTDQAETWSEAGQLPTGDNVRLVTFSDFGDGLFYALVDGGLIYRSADGVEWTDALPTQGSCDGGNFSRRGGAVDIDGVYYVVSDAGNVCRTEDGGATITHHTFGNGDVLTSPIVAAGDMIYGIGGTGAWRSADGMNWEQLSFQVDGDPIRTVAYSDATSTMIGIAANGDHFYRSTDGGASWARSTAPEGNATNRAGFGYASSSDMCP